jgi:hypothetical protein
MDGQVPLTSVPAPGHTMLWPRSAIWPGVPSGWRDSYGSTTAGQRPRARRCPYASRTPPRRGCGRFHDAGSVESRPSPDLGTLADARWPSERGSFRCSWGSQVSPTSHFRPLECHTSAGLWALKRLTVDQSTLRFMPAPSTKTNLDRQRHPALRTARVGRRGVWPASRAEGGEPRRSARAWGSSRMGRRAVGAIVVATATVTVLLAVPPLRAVADQISRMSVAWVGGAVILEIASCAAYVVIFRLFFATVPADLARSPGPKRHPARCCPPAASEHSRSAAGSCAKAECQPGGSSRTQAHCSS